MATATIEYERAVSRKDLALLRSLWEVPSAAQLLLCIADHLGVPSLQLHEFETSLALPMASRSLLMALRAILAPKPSKFPDATEMPLRQVR